MKYAMVWTTDESYMPGTNATLNALEYYKNEVDVYVLTWGNFLTEEYKSQFPNVNFIQIDEKAMGERDTYWVLTHYDLWYASNNLFDKYDVVLFWGADVCLTSNIMDYFKISETLDKMILGSNEQGVTTYRSMSKEKPYGHTWDVPYADVPFFVPKSCKDVLDMIVELDSEPESQLCRMDSLNYAIRDLEKQVFTVSGFRWVMNVPNKHIVDYNEEDNTIFAEKIQMPSFHRKYWSVSYLKNYIRGMNEIAQHNALVFNKLYNFFNNQRVKWDKGVEKWDGIL